MFISIAKRWEKTTETNVQESAKCLDLLKEESKLDLKIEDTVTEDVTHYVAKMSEDKVVEKGDLNYYLALVGGKWIVSFKCGLKLCFTMMIQRDPSAHIQGGAGGQIHGLVETDLDVAQLGKQRNTVN